MGARCCNEARLGGWLALVLVLVGCGPQGPSPGADSGIMGEVQIVRLGFAAPLTGPQAHYGKEMGNGVLLAVEEINGEAPRIGGGPVRFELLSEDDQADPKQGPLVAQKLLDAGIRGMLGHFNSGTSIPAARLYAAAGIPQLAMATAPAYTAGGYRTTFRMMTNDQQQGGILGRFLVERLGVRRLALIDDRTAYGQGLADQVRQAAQAAGAEIVAREYTHDKASDFLAILTNIKAADPDGLFFGGADVQAGPMVRQLRQLGMGLTFVGGEMLKSPTFLKLAGDAGEGTIASLAGLPLERMPGGPAYGERYLARFGMPVETYSPYAYDATRVLVEAMRRADSTEPSVYLPVLAQIQTAGVTSGRIAYDQQGDLRDSPITLYKVEQGQWRVLETAGAVQAGR